MATKTQTKSKTTSQSRTAGRSSAGSKSAAGSRTAPKSSGSSRAKSSKSKSEDMPNSKFHELFVDQLKDIYWAEKNLVKALGKMQKAATSEELADAIATHQEQTRGQVSRIEQVFESIGQTAKAKKCPAMEGLIAEGQEVIEDTEEDSAVRDAGLIICCQKIEHYEIASYGSLRTLAARMGHEEAVQLLEQTLNEEKETDVLLTQLAESSVNEEAAAE
ncbi:YciE/YciF ferroxidase family protein [Chitinophaga rhizophila]|uniref:Ferritin-like domain-containing protein n=1 Tax=Chitinophaga rhizophila TaxID=2866212 RepID=A0ABS7GF87_9BACT|nr:ferritin-like domain-containing protein [Chitinophaga rhizophila]MBW8686344.1 ferritin-like domain-containing protein [Chitinophaga rhizophila]